MLTFRSLELKDKAWVESRRDPQSNPFTALSFPSLFSWREAYGLTIAGDSDWFVIRSSHDRAFFCPCGSREKCEAFIRDAGEGEAPPNFLYLTREDAKRLQLFGYRYILRDDLSEYVSSAAALALEEGHHMSNSFKRKVRRFQQEHRYRVQPVRQADLPALTQASLRCGDHQGDEEALKVALDHFSALEMRGLQLEMADGRQAFLLGYPNTQDEFTMTLARHDPSLPAEITAVLVHETAKMIREEYPLVNLEEDLGLPGLRRAKLLYSPVDRLNVYEAIR